MTLANSLDNMRRPTPGTNLAVPAPGWATIAREAAAESRWFLAATAVQLLVSAVFCGRAHMRFLAGPLEAYGSVFGATLIFGTMGLAVALFRRRLLAAPTASAPEAYAEAWSDLRRRVLAPRRLAAIGIALLVAPLALSAFSAAKQAIPWLHPFTWDPAISRWDGALDGGVPLWQRLQPIFGRPSVTILLDYYYYRIWMALLLGIFVHAALSRPSPRRSRFLLTFVLVLLVVGNLLALVLASAGPPYFGRVTHGLSDPYTAQWMYLQSIGAYWPLQSAISQGALWDAYVSRIENLGFGISAMPSVHVATAALTTIYGFHVGRTAGIALTGVAILTFVASVVLGWHYALDGYVGAFLAWGLWWFAGLLTRPATRRNVIQESGT